MRVAPGPTTGPVAARIAERRGGELRPLDLALLHDEEVADGWNHFIGALRTSRRLSDLDRELIVLRIAVLNEASYEWAAHAPVARAAGATDEQLEAVRSRSQSWSSVFTPTTQALLAFVDRSTSNVAVDNNTAQQLIDVIGDAGFVEAALVTAAYNMVSRFLVSVGLSDTDLDGVVA
jgi:AhpD family alkylhydroperoxidase